MHSVHLLFKPKIGLRFELLVFVPEHVLYRWLWYFTCCRFEWGFRENTNQLSPVCSPPPISCFLKTYFNIIFLFVPWSAKVVWLLWLVVLYDFPQSLEACAGIIVKIMPWLVPSVSFPVYCLLIFRQPTLRSSSYWQRHKKICVIQRSDLYSSGSSGCQTNASCHKQCHRFIVTSA